MAPPKMFWPSCEEKKGLFFSSVEKTNRVALIGVEAFFEGGKHFSGRGTLSERNLLLLHPGGHFWREILSPSRRGS